MNETEREKIQVFMVHEPDGFHAVCEGQEFGYMRSLVETDRRWAWSGLILIMARTIMLLRRDRRQLQEELNEIRKQGDADTVLASEVRQRHELQDEIDRIEGYRQAEHAAMVGLEHRYENLASRMKAVERHRDRLLSQQKAIHKIMNSGEGE